MFVSLVQIGEHSFLQRANGGVTATLEKGGQIVPDSKQMVCGNYNLVMKVLGGQEYMLVLRADGSGGPLRFVDYTLTIKVTP